MLLVVGCLFCDVMFVVYCLLFVVRCVLLVVCCLSNQLRVRMFVCLVVFVCSSVAVAFRCCRLFVVCCVLYVLSCVLLVVRCVFLLCVLLVVCC